MIGDRAMTTADREALKHYLNRVAVIPDYVGPNAWGGHIVFTKNTLTLPERDEPYRESERQMAVRHFLRDLIGREP